MSRARILQSSPRLIGICVASARRIPFMPTIDGRLRRDIAAAARTQDIDMSRASMLPLFGLMSMLLPATCCAVPPAASAHGDEEDAAQGIAVRFDAADLRSAAGAHRLLDRIGDAALEACGASAFSLAELQRLVGQSDCWTDAVERAVRHIGAPALDEKFLYMVIRERKNTR